MRLIRVAPVAALCSELLADRSRSNLDEGLMTGIEPNPDGSRRIEFFRPKLMCFASAAAPSIAKGSDADAALRDVGISVAGELLDEGSSRR